MRPLLLLAGALCSAALAQTVDVGSGAPTEAIRTRFVQAFFRNGFSGLVSTPPLGPVRGLGSTGLVQEFQDVNKTANVRLALIKADASQAYPAMTQDGTEIPDVLQVQAGMYAYFNSLGVGTVGYPTTDTLTCTGMLESPCQYQFFNRNYVLFVYQMALATGQDFAVRDPYYTKWLAVGGMGGLGPARTAETAVTALAGGSQAAMQGYARGAIFRYTSGALNGKLFAVQQPIFDLYFASGGQTGPLGLPISDELGLPNGGRRQTFEGGRIEYQSGTGPVMLLAVATISLVPSSGPLRLNLGESITLRAVMSDTNGADVSDRAVTWSTSNSAVASIQGSGNTAVVTATGGGVATVIAVSEGKASQPLAILVTAPCCQVGEGAPNAAVQQAFRDAVTRNRLVLRLPSESAAHRLGPGYVQEFVSADGSIRYLIAEPDLLGTAFVLSGEILSRYQQLGGPSGPLGYPVSDATPGGRQMFQRDTALVGLPVRTVSGAILARWGVAGYETGAVGPPLAEAASYLSFTGSFGQMQVFRDGAVFASEIGAQAGKTFLVLGPLLLKYLALGGASGRFGAPVADEVVMDGRRRQDFEGGYIDLGPGDSEAQPHERERRPTVSVAPAVVPAGTRVRITVGGFDEGSALRISVTDQPDFEVKTQSGAWRWEVFVPAGAPSGNVVIRAVDPASGASAEGSYRVKALAELSVRLRKVQGDLQSAPPGARLPQTLRISLRDDSGNALAGAAVRFNASPGAQVAPASAVTDQNGEAEAVLRLPLSQGVALVTAEALRQVVTFSAQVVPASLANFPKVIQTGDTALGKGPATIAQKGSLLAVAAGILRYYQARGELPAQNGMADAALLNQYLTDFCVLDAQANQLCDGYITSPGSGEQTVNLWRLANFVSGNLDVVADQPDPASIRDVLALGHPVAVALALKAGDASAGAHFVVATGVAGDGSIQIRDPNPTLGRSNLNDYLSGFAAAGQSWRGALSAVFHLAPRSPSPNGFLIAAINTAIDVSSPAGACGETLEWPNVIFTGTALPGSPGMFRLRYCSGEQSIYRLDIAGDGNSPALVTDLSPVSGQVRLTAQGGASYQVTRPAAQLAIVPQVANFASAGVVNAANYSSAIAPAGLISIFGSGLARSGSQTTVDFNGVAAQIVAATSFQINAQVPPDLAPGIYVLRVRSPYGTAEQTVLVQATAPGIFLVDTAHGAVFNQDNTLNLPVNPARRGQVITVYCTGLGAVMPQGELQVARMPVTALVGGQSPPVDFAGQTPGYTGLYQVNVRLPNSTPPGLGIPLVLVQSDAASNTIEVAIQ